MYNNLFDFLSGIHAKKKPHNSNKVHSSHKHVKKLHKDKLGSRRNFIEATDYENNFNRETVTGSSESFVDQSVAQNPGFGDIGTPSDSSERLLLPAQQFDQRDNRQREQEGREFRGKENSQDSQQRPDFQTSQAEEENQDTREKQDNGRFRRAMTQLLILMKVLCL